MNGYDYGQLQGSSIFYMTFSSTISFAICDEHEWRSIDLTGCYELLLLHVLPVMPSDCITD